MAAMISEDSNPANNGLVHDMSNGSLLEIGEEYMNTPPIEKPKFDRIANPGHPPSNLFVVPSMNGHMSTPTPSTIPNAKKAVMSTSNGNTNTTTKYRDILPAVLDDFNISSSSEKKTTSSVIRKEMKPATVSVPTKVKVKGKPGPKPKLKRVKKFIDDEAEVSKHHQLDDDPNDMMDTNDMDP